MVELQSRQANPPAAPRDFRRESRTGCHCNDCKVLSQFLDDPNANTLRMPLPERRRMHLHQLIDRKQLDTTHVTERTGRPYTLVCTKTTASYEAALKIYRQSLNHLASMQQMLDWHEALK